MRNRDKFVVTQNLYLQRLRSGHLSSDHVMATSVRSACRLLAANRSISNHVLFLYCFFFFFFFFWCLFIFEWLVQQEPMATPLRRKRIFLLHTRHPFAKSFLSHLFISPALVVFYFFSHLSLSLFLPYLFLHIHRNPTAVSSRTLPELAVSFFFFSFFAGLSVFQIRISADYLNVNSSPMFSVISCIYLFIYPFAVFFFFLLQSYSV